MLTYADVCGRMLTYADVRGYYNTGEGNTELSACQKCPLAIDAVSGDYNDIESALIVCMRNATDLR